MAMACVTHASHESRDDHGDLQSHSWLMLQPLRSVGPELSGRHWRGGVTQAGIVRRSVCGESLGCGPHCCNGYWSHEGLLPRQRLLRTRYPAPQLLDHDVQVDQPHWQLIGVVGGEAVVDGHALRLLLCVSDLADDVPSLQHGALPWLHSKTRTR